MATTVFVNETAPRIATTSVLLIEDSQDDIIQIREYLSEESIVLSPRQFEVTSATTLREGLEFLQEEEEDWDIVLLDLRLPDSTGAETFRKAHEAAKDTPILLLTHNADEKLAVDLLGEGAQDYLFKSELRGRLLQRAVRYALQRSAILREKQAVIAQREKALAEVRRLQDLLPICSKCKKVRTDDGFWRQVDEYISEHSDARFTHGLCPDCARTVYTEHHEPGER